MTKPSAPEFPRRIGERYDREQAEALWGLPIGELMQLAHRARRQRFDNYRVTFVIDTNPNYTNICDTRCSFCAFWRSADHQEAYTLTPQALADRVENAHRRGATTVLLQGGNNPALGLGDWLAYIEAIQTTCPDIHLHPFSPSEYAFLARRENRPVREVLIAVHQTGVTTMPGGGAEILVDRVRGEISPDKISASQWLEVSETAHQVGFRTTATMMYGHLERPQDIIDHLLRLRDVQDRTGGFSSFIPWSFKPNHTKLSGRVDQPAHPLIYVRVIALARLLLDNFEHIQSSWFSESIEAGQLGLLAGADDFGGILLEENVLKTTGHNRSTNLQTVQTIIQRTGFVPTQRDGYYQLINPEPPRTGV